METEHGQTDRRTERHDALNSCLEFAEDDTQKILDLRKRNL